MTDLLTDWVNNAQFKLFLIMGLPEESKFYFVFPNFYVYNQYLVDSWQYNSFNVSTIIFIQFLNLLIFV